MIRKIVVSTSLLAIALLVGIFYLFSRQVDGVEEQSARRISLAVLAFEWDSDQALTSAVAGSLGEDVTVVHESVPASQVPSLDELAKHLGVDAVLWGEKLHVGRFEGVNAFLFHKGERHHVWAYGRPHVSFRRYQGRIARDIARAVRSRLGVAPDGDAALHPGAGALQDYLEGRSYLDRHRTAHNLEAAATHFEAALQEFAAYAEAHAGMCDTLVEQFRSEGERNVLEDARIQCRRGLELAPVQPEVLVAQGNLLREHGALEDAIAAFDKALKRDAWLTHAYLGMAETHLAAYRKKGLQGLQGEAERGIQRAEQAMQVDPQLWKAPYLLGRIYYFTGNLEQAIEAMEEAKSLNANEQVLSDLANLYACHGESRRAVAAYRQAQKITGAEANFPDFPSYDCR